ncbi:hypothetical protein [Demequina subtropica]|uniref:DUF7937 domain-containing protein n=1 Tax=Demequina subtropica TaxID=1638989 RepID=UPI0007862A43|nr:hypothetical protein [Demequina subtropica]
MEQQQGYGYGQPQAAPPGHAQASIFSGIPVADYVRDGAALVLLLTSLALPWNAADQASDRIEVLLLTILSVLSLSAMYLHRSGVIPPTLTADRVGMLRALANAPYLVVVVIHLILDFASAFGEDSAYDYVGVGPGLALGLAGAILAAQPRECELAASTDRARIAELWRRVGLGVAGLALVSSTIALIALLVHSIGDDYRWFGGWLITLIWVRALTSLAMVLAMCAPFVLRTAPARTAAIAFAGALLGAQLISLMSEGSGNGIESVSANMPALWAVLALGAVLVAPSARDFVTPAEGPHLYLPAASILLLGFSVLAFAEAFTYVLILAAGDTATGTMATILVLTAVIGIALLVARAALMRDGGTNRNTVLAVLGAVAVLGIVLLVVTANASDGYAAVDRTQLLLAFGAPIAIAVMLLVPASVRAYYGQFAPARPVAAPATGPIPTVPTSAPAAAAPPAPPAPPAPTAPPAPPAPAVDPALVAAAHDPATDAATLHRIAAEAPSLRAAVAAHPNAYPDLLQWLGSLGDPEVDAALAQRS